MAVQAPAVAVSAVLPPQFSAVHEARVLVHSALDGWDAAELADDVALVVSELVSNALLHGLRLPIGNAGEDLDDGLIAGRAGEVELQMVSTGSHLICTVHDPSPAPPVLAAPADSELGGRGLQLIESLSLCWGWTPSGGAKSVWAIFSLPRGQRERQPVLQAG